MHWCVASDWNQTRFCWQIHCFPVMWLPMIWYPQLPSSYLVNYYLFYSSNMHFSISRLNSYTTSIMEEWLCTYSFNYRLCHTRKWLMDQKRTSIFINLKYIYIYIYTLPHDHDVTQAQLFKQSFTGLESEFSFF